MEFGIEKCAMLIMKSGKWQTTEEIEQPNQEKIRTLREKETYRYLGILEADTSRDKQKIKERENDSKSNYIAEISSKI